MYAAEVYAYEFHRDLMAYMRGEITEKTPLLVEWQERAKRAKAEYREWLAMWDLEF